MANPKSREDKTDWCVDLHQNQVIGLSKDASLLPAVTYPDIYNYQTVSV